MLRFCVPAFSSLFSLAFSLSSPRFLFASAVATANRKTGYKSKPLGRLREAPALHAFGIKRFWRFFGRLRLACTLRPPPAGRAGCPGLGNQALPASPPCVRLFLLFVFFLCSCCSPALVRLAEPSPAKAGAQPPLLLVCSSVVVRLSLFAPCSMPICFASNVKS